MQKIIPYLWFDTQAEEAVNFYVSRFNNSRIGHAARYDKASAEASGRPAGSVMTVAFELEGQQFVALNGGPVFAFSPAVSFFVSCETEQEVDGLYAGLSAGGEVLMPLGDYGFSRKFGWINDRYGVSWQFNLAPRPQKITPFLLFVREVSGKAEEAMKRYVSLIENSRITNIVHYNPGEEEPEGTVKHATFTLGGSEFMAMDSNREHPFTFTPAISFLVNCMSQEEVDRLWERFSDGGEKQPCGWVRDRYGVSWQIIPTVLGELLGDKDPVKAGRVMKAMLEMQKIDIAKLKKAYERA
jgi:predicted 3-demethylubiquinone-9 3-methyltransferase (glyoxalase superfamily)